MSLQTNLLGLYQYLLGTQQRREEDRLRGTLPGRLSSPLLSQGAPKCHLESAFLQMLRKARMPSCLPVHAQSLPCVLRYSLTLTKNRLK